MHFKKQLKNMFRNSIRLKIGTPAKEIPGGTRFGGAPDVPAGFTWPVFTGEWYGEEGKTRKERPLSFLAQFDCAGLAAYDADGLLPHTGLLSFFYEVETQRWGYDPKDAGCARVFWFEDAAPLHRMEPPAALREEHPPYTLPDFGVFPPLKIALESVPSLPGAADYICLLPGLAPGDWARFEKERAMFGMEPEGQISKLLGWPDVIQSNMTTECELVSRGYYLGDAWADVPDAEIREAERSSFEGWRLLFQLDSLQKDGVDLMFGDCGRIYFYIRTEDLKARRFDRTWLILQCD